MYIALNVPTTMDDNMDVPSKPSPLGCGIGCPYLDEDEGGLVRCVLTYKCQSNHTHFLYKCRKASQAGQVHHTAGEL